MHGFDRSFGPDLQNLARAFAGRGRGGFGPGGPGGPGRARRGDVRAAILRVLAEEPMHGYQIIQEITERSGGAWSPSAGSIYPALQLLADEGLVASRESGGKRVFSLTETGTAAVADLADEPAPWESAGAGGDPLGVGALRESGGRLASAVIQAARSGDKALIAETAAILDAARKQVYALLAKD